eukprot:TRINITY_DN3082_c0_g1_i1.p1 TRINITY_DN3082_c0_g1~~TRINITY_DN3082_c0_g1_i1.p1  ORF type:complete len:122 (+),score=14.70 TRINITY_DN3082_c0_g1_i1:141-506(+)
METDPTGKLQTVEIVFQRYRKSAMQVTNLIKHEMKLLSMDFMEVFCASYGHLNIELPISQEESISILLQEKIRRDLTPRVIKAIVATDASPLKEGIAIKTSNTTKVQSKEADCSNDIAPLE